jgi:hypothetical protein
MHQRMRLSSGLTQARSCPQEETRFLSGNSSQQWDSKPDPELDVDTFGHRLSLVSDSGAPTGQFRITTELRLIDHYSRSLTA